MFARMHPMGRITAVAISTLLTSLALVSSSNATASAAEQQASPVGKATRVLDDTVIGRDMRRRLPLRWQLCPTTSSTEELKVRGVRCRGARAVARRAKKRLCQTRLGMSCREAGGTVIGLMPGQISGIKGRVRVMGFRCRASFGYEWRSAACRKGRLRFDFWNGV